MSLGCDALLVSTGHRTAIMNTKLLHAACLAALCGFAPASRSSAAGESRPKLEELVADLGNRTVEDGQAVGLQVAVARGETTICSAGFGLANVELDIPVTPQTVFRIGSVTKEFTAAAILLLVEEGRVDLDASLSRYLPEYPSHASDVTIRHLLQHTSGIQDFTRQPDYRAERSLDLSPNQVLERFQHLPLEFSPGEKHRYCNSGYILLARVIEAVSGESYREFVEKRLIERLELKQIYCDGAMRIIPHRASGYTSWGGTLRKAAYVNVNQSTGAGNIAATASDLVTWRRSLTSERLLSKESTELMTARGRTNDGKRFDYGFGLRVRSMAGHAVIRHGGGISGYRADLACYPESGITIAVLANSDRVNTAKLSDQIARFLLKTTDDETE